jgi:hypothetical protein
MVQRIIETEQDRHMLFRFLEGQKLPMTVDIKAGGRRTAKQNRLQRQWMNEIAMQSDMTPEEARGYCKLHFGVPILREEDGEFREKYDRVVKPLDYETKLMLMQEPFDFPVTRLMTVKQHTVYLDAVYQHFAARGFDLTDPGDLLSGARKAA